MHTLTLFYKPVRLDKVALILLATLQCASIVKGGKQEVSIRLTQSDVADAKVSVYNARNLSDNGELVRLCQVA